MYEGPTLANDSEAPPPLARYKSLQLNYGDGGGEPLSFVVEDGQDIDVGFVKFYVSTEPFSLTSVEQPALETIAPEAGRRRALVRHRVSSETLIVHREKWDIVHREKWDELTIPVKQSTPANSPL